MKFKKKSFRLQELKMLRCRYCRETENLSQYKVVVPIDKQSEVWRPRAVMHCNRCGYNRVG